MAFTIGSYGVQSILSLGKLMATFYATCLLFIFLVLGLITRLHGFGILPFLRYIREEILLVLGTSSSEAEWRRYHRRRPLDGGTRCSYSQSGASCRTGGFSAASALSYNCTAATKRTFKTITCIVSARGEGDACKHRQIRDQS
jgi:hypothetical protein